jgi:ribosomal protein S18 acetylase RimI-like enzyme
MTTQQIDIRRAGKADMPGILKLQRANQQAQGGTLAAELTADQIEMMMTDMPQVIACRGAEVVGFLMTTSAAVCAQRPIPVITETLKAYPWADQDAYIYGPVCVSANERGQGVAQKLFEKLLELEPGRQGILFIRNDNAPSLRAHSRMGMNKVAQFTLNQSVFNVFAYKSMPAP